MSELNAIGVALQSALCKYIWSNSIKLKFLLIQLIFQTIKVLIAESVAFSTSLNIERQNWRFAFEFRA